MFVRKLSLTLLLVAAIVGCKRPIAEDKNPQVAQGDNKPAAQPEKKPAAAPLTPPAAPGDLPPKDVVNPVLKAGFLTADEVADGWVSLFDGHSLFGWESDQKDVNWTVKNGVITADTGPIGLLLTTVKYANYELVCEYRMAAEGNSGVFLRAAENRATAATDFYEVNIADAHPEGYLTASLVGRVKAEKDIKGSGEWHTLRMIADGNHVQAYYDSEKVLDYLDSTAGARTTGRIGLQKNVGKIEFRKVVMKPLGLNNLIGEGISGWKKVPGSKSTFENTDGTITVKNGQGFLETEEEFANFVLQGQARTNSADLNSGIFFRAMTGTAAAPSNGYELQIHNGFNEGDRSQAKDAGTGAIFRRISARRVVGNDKEWVTFTLVTDGPKMATFVDGYQVVAWQDDRPEKDNPREGRRLTAGHLSLQGHDATTDVSFRALRIAETPGTGESIIPPSFAPNQPGPTAPQ